MKRVLLEYLPAWLLLMVFGFIVIHAPLTVWLGVQVPQLAVPIKAWKEVLTLGALALLTAALYQRGRLNAFVRQPLIAIALVYSALHVFMIGLYPQGLQATVAGLLIDLRYVLYFVAVAAFLHLYPSYARSFLRVGVVGAVIVIGFAVMQLFLPKDILSTLGYGANTIEPYLTVDKNPDYIRFNSTLRGPNPLGAYATIVLVGVAAFVLHARRSVKAGAIPWLAGALGVGGVVALWVSYSRSALVAALVAVSIVLVARYGALMNRWAWYGAAAVFIAAAGVIYVAKDTTFIQNVVLHNNPGTGAVVDSNTAHAESLFEGLGRMAIQPLGAGIGSTGSASLLGSTGLIIENQYLMIAHEVGWLGLGLFLVLFCMVLRQLWRQRKNWLALGVFASGLGLAVIGLMLPVWADDTVSIVWWGLVAIALWYKQRQLTTTSGNHKM